MGAAERERQSGTSRGRRDRGGVDSIRRLTPVPSSRGGVGSRAGETKLPAEVAITDRACQIARSISLTTARDPAVGGDEMEGRTFKGKNNSIRDCHDQQAGAAMGIGSVGAQGQEGGWGPTCPARKTKSKDGMKMVVAVGSCSLCLPSLSCLSLESDLSCS